MLGRPWAQQTVHRLMTRESFTQRNSFNFTLAYQAYLLHRLNMDFVRRKVTSIHLIFHEQGARLSSLFCELQPVSFQVDRID